MTDYSFRLRFNRSPTDTINVPSSSLELSSTGSAGHVIFSSGDRSKTIQESERLVLQGSGWASVEQARGAGLMLQDVLMRTLARLQIGADFGVRAPKGRLTAAGLAMFEQQFGQRILNDTHGLMVFETQPMPRFALLSTPSLMRGTSQERFQTVFSFAMSQECAISDRERVSFDLFNSSFFQQSADARFLLLVVAVESLLDPRPRSDHSTQHVEHLIGLTQASNLLPPNEKASMIGSLQWMRQESIGQAGRRLAHERLGTRRYMDLDAAKFFSHVYDLRSRLVHGATHFPTRDEISMVAASLEVFVSDLLSGPLLEV